MSTINPSAPQSDPICGSYTFSPSEPESAPPPKIFGRNGVFTITTSDGQVMQVDFGVMAMFIALRRTQVLDLQVDMKTREVLDLNEKLKLFNDIMGMFRKAVADGKGLNDEIVWRGEKTTPNKIRRKYNISLPTEKDGDSHPRGCRPRGSNNINLWEKRWELNIHKLNGEIENLGTDQQELTNKMNDLIQKRNNSFKAASKFLSNNNQSLNNSIKYLQH